MAKDRSGRFVAGLLVGSALGAIAGILLTPRTGRETRQLLKKSADALPELVEDLSSSLQLQAGRISEGTLRQWEQTLDRLKEAIAAGKAATEAELAQLNPQEASPEESTAPSVHESSQ